MGYEDLERLEAEVISGPHTHLLPDGNLEVGMLVVAVNGSGDESFEFCVCEAPKNMPLVGERGQVLVYPKFWSCFDDASGNGSDRRVVWAKEL